MAQTAYAVPAGLPDPVGITDGTATRQWMTPDGFYLNEVIASGGAGVNPVVQTCG
jgi:hypothetical protein